MNVLEIQIVESIDAYNDENIESDYKITCFTGSPISRSKLVEMGENMGEESTLLWGMHKNNVQYTVLIMIACAQTLGILISLYLALNRLCHFHYECMLCMFPVCLILTIFLMTVMILKIIQTNWISRCLCTIENNCAFLVKTRKGSLPCIVFLDQGIKSKTYGLNNKSFPISLLHFKHSNTSLIKVALFHLPQEVCLHQAIGCDVNDSLQYYHTLGLPNYNFLGILIVFYYDLQNKIKFNRETINNFILFLEKSGFKVLNHKLNFAISAVKDRYSSSYDKTRWDMNIQDSSIQILLPQSITNTRAHGLCLDQS